VISDSFPAARLIYDFFRPRYYHHLKLPTRLRALLPLALGFLGFYFAATHMSQSIWQDEAQTLSIAQKPTLAEVAKASLQERPYPPFFFFAVHYSLRFRNDETGLRLPAAIFGGLATIAVFALGNLTGGWVIGMLAALFFLLGPGVFRYFVDANAYTLLILMVAVSTLLLVRSIKSNTPVAWFGYIFSVLLGLGTHLVFLLYLGAQIAGAAFWFFSQSGDAAKSHKYFLGTVLLLIVAAGLAIAFYFHGGGLSRPVHLSQLSSLNTMLSIAGMYFGPLSIGYRSQLAVWVSLQLLGAAVLLTLQRKIFWPVALSITLSLLALTLFIKATVGYVAYKYGLGLFPLACVIAAYGSRFMVERQTPWHTAVKRLASAGAALYCILGGIFLARADRSTFEFQNWKGAAEYLRTHSAAIDTIVVSNRDLPAFSYYYRDPATVVTDRESSRSYDAITSSLAKGNRRAWVLISTFENDSPLVGSFTNRNTDDLRTRTLDLVAALKNRGVTAEEAIRLHRVNVVVCSFGRF